MVAKATHLAGTAYAPSTNSTYGKAWTRFSTFCTKNGVDPWSASDGDICLFIIARAKETASLAMVESDFKTVLSIRKHSGTNVCNVPFPHLVVRGLMQAIESEELLQLPFDPEIVHILLKHSPCVQGLASFLVLWQSAIICCLYWGDAVFDEIVALQIRHIIKRGDSFELQISARRDNLTTASRRVII